MRPEAREVGESDYIAVQNFDLIVTAFRNHIMFQSRKINGFFSG